MAIAPDAAKIGPYTAPSIDDAHDDAARDAGNKKAILQQLVKRTTLTKEIDKQESLEGVPARDRKRMSDALDGAFGPEARAWAGNPHIQRNLTTLQRREQLLSMADNAPGARPAAQSMQSLSQDPNFSKLMPAGRSSQLMSEVHQSLAANPKLEGSIKQALQSAFVRSDKGLPQTKQDFARFALKMGGQNNSVSIKKAGDMLGTLAGQQISTRAQSDALRMAERDPSNLGGMDAVEGFARQEDVMALPRPAASAAVSLLSRANGTEEARQGLTEITRDDSFSNLSDENKAGVFEAMNRSKTADVVALKQTSLKILSLPNIAGVDGRITRMLDKYGQQVATGGAKGVHPGTLARASRARVLPGPPALVDTHDIEDPDDRARAGRQNRAKLKEYANDVDRAYREMDRGLDRATSFDDVNGLTGLQEPECYDRPKLDDASTKSDIDRMLGALQSRDPGNKMPNAAREEMMDDVATASVLSRDEQQVLATLIDKTLAGKISLAAYRDAKMSLLQPVIEQRFAAPPNEKARAYATIAVKNAKLAAKLNISEQEQQKIDEILAPLSEGATSRRMSAADFDSALKEVEQGHLRSVPLSPSEVTYLSARVQSVRLRRQFGDVSIKKNKILKELRRKPLTAEQRRKKAAARRAVGVQARYVAVDPQKASVLGASALPTAARSAPASVVPSVARPASGRELLARGSNERQQLVADVATQVIEQLVNRGLLGGRESSEDAGPKRSAAPVEAVSREQPRGQAAALVNQIMDRLSRASGKDNAGLAPELPSSDSPTLPEISSQAPPTNARPATWTQGLVDKNGIPRTFPRDLAGLQGRAPVRPPKNAKARAPLDRDDDEKQGR